MSSEPLVQALLRRFVARRDAWVVQSVRDGRYRSQRGFLPEQMVRAHLAGRLSLCAYCLAPGSDGEAPWVRWGAFDLDAHTAAVEDGRLAPGPRRALFDLAGALAGCLEALVGSGPVLCEATGGRGVHVWLLLDEAAPAPVVRSVLDAALAHAGLEAGARIEAPEGLWVERYPKADTLADGQVGFALRLPFGVHPTGGRRSLAFDPATGARRDPLACLYDAAAGGLSVGQLEACLRDVKLAAPSATQPMRAPRICRTPAPDAWLTYRWAACRLGLGDRTTAAPPAVNTGRGYPVRCLFPSAHAHGDLGIGSAYVIRRGDIQIYGCAVCEGGMAIDSIALVRRVEPALSFAEALERCHEIDPIRCPGRGAGGGGPLAPTTGRRPARADLPTPRSSATKGKTHAPDIG